MCNCLGSIIVLCGVIIKGREKVKPGACSSRKAPRGAARLNVPIRRTNRYQNTYCRGVNLYVIDIKHIK